MGALNNLYVSSSFQGLMKLTNSATGLTNSLQTIQAGDGSDSPLQMSLTQVNISGSFTVNGSSVTAGTSGTSGSNGTDGSSGTSGSNGTNGSSGTSGSNGSSGSSGLSGTSGTSGSNGTNGSSGTSGSNGTNGSSGTSGSNGTNGSSGSNGTDGSSGTSGNDGLGLPSKVIPLDATGWSFGSSYSTKTITFAQPFASSDYVVDFIFNTNSVGDELPYYDFSGPSYLAGYSGKSASGLTLYVSIDLTQASYSGWTGYVQCIAAGASNGSGSSGTSGSNGSSGTSGSNGTNGSSGSSGTSGQNGISAGRTYYFNQSQTSDVAGYKILSETPTTGTTQTVTTNLTGNQQNVLVQSYITPQLGFNIIPAGVQRFHLHLLKPASNDDIDVYVTLQLANSTGGTIDSLITSSANIITWNSGNPSEVYVDIVFSSTVIDPTNRMIVKIYLNNNESSAMSVDFDTEGNEYSYVITSVGVVAGTSGTSGTNGTSGTSATGGGGSSVIQVTGVTLASGSWSLSSSLYIYDYSNTGITTGSSVMVIPSNDSVQTIINAQVLPTTLSTSGSVRLYSTYQPAANIGATINITETTIQ